MIDVRLLHDPYNRNLVPYFEITEQALLDNSELVSYMSRHYGVKFSIDDFGTGYSSFNMLGELSESGSISHLKIDGSLTTKILKSEASYKLVKSTCEMAKKLELKTIAEFVESEGIVNALIELGVDYGQGYDYSRAIPR